ncbi:unnamed protein product [Prunus brigantina]
MMRIFGVRLLIKRLWPREELISAWWCWWWILGGAPARCSESDGRMIYGVNDAITRMMLRLLEKSRVRSPGGPIEAEKDLPEGLKNIYMVESDWGK